MLESIILGSYTRRKSQGIYQISLDTTTQELTKAKLVAKEISPTYLTRSQSGNLYTVSTVDGQGGIAAYTSDYKLINYQVKDGAPLCYVAVDEKRQLVYGANYHQGEVVVYKINEDGGLTETDSLIHQEATGSNENQNSPHVHYTDLTPDGRLAVCDLGTDRLYTYDVSPEGKLTLVASYLAEDATGPRHLVFHPNGHFAYLFGELDSSVTVLAYDAQSGSFTKKQKLSTLPEDFTEANGGAAIRISNDGRFLYASNRGHNSIVVYQVNPAGDSLTVCQWISTEGDFPRDFALNPDNQFLVCGNQNTDNLTLYSRDAESGKLSLLQKDIYAPECVCVYFEKE